MQYRTTASTNGWALSLALFALVSACNGERTPDGDAAEEERAPADTLKTIRVIPDVRTPESVRVGPDGRYYVSEIGGFGQDGDGRILAIDPETWEPTVHAEGLNDPKGLAFRGDTLFVTDRDRIVRVAPDGSTEVVVEPSAFPNPPVFLNDLAVGPDGRLYVSDTGEFESVDGHVYGIDRQGRVETIASSADDPEIASPNGLTFAPDGALLIVDLQTGKLLRRSGSGAPEVVAEGFGGGDGLEFAPDGRLYLTDVGNGRVFRVTFEAGGARARQIGAVRRAADLGLDSARGLLLIPQLELNSITVLELP